MAALSGLLGWPIARLGTHPAFARTVSLSIGCISTALGLFWGVPLIEHLFEASTTTAFHQRAAKPRVFRAPDHSM